MNRQLPYALVACFALLVFLSMNVLAQTCTNLSGTISTSSQKSSCSGDGVADIVNVAITGNRGTNYALLFTDANDVIKKIINAGSFDMEGWYSDVYNVRGISYENNIVNLQVGKKVSQLSGCYALSTTGFTVTIFNKEAGTISTTGGRTDTTICVDDGKADVLPLTYTGLQAFGMMFVLTNTSDVITSVHFNVPNLEGTGVGTVKLWLVTSCFETFTLNTGIPISSLGGTLDYSNAITITKRTGCAPICAPENVACPGKVLMCINNVSTCVAQKDVNKKLKAGGTLGGCIKCTQPTLRASRPVDITDAGESVKLYPNPTRGVLNISSNYNAEAQVTLLDNSGRMIYQQKMQLVKNASSRIDLQRSKLPAGMYTLMIRSAGHSEVKKVWIQ